MVKTFPILLTLVCGGASLPAADNLPQEMGEQLNGKNIEVTWEAPTNKLPATLSVFKVLPTRFPAYIISNLVTIAEFKEPEKARAALTTALAGKDAIYQEPDTGKHLGIFPTKGYISYHNLRVIALPKQPAEGVPSKQETLDLALRLLPKLGIDTSQLARKPDSNDLQLAHVLREEGSFDKQRKQHIKRTLMQGVIFGRAVDGIEFNGLGDCGSIRITFGNHASIAELVMVWRNLKLERKVPVANTQRIVQWLKEGQVLMEPDEVVNPRQIKKLVITRIIPYYLGKDTAEIQRIVLPYAMLTAMAYTPSTNATVRLHCPIHE